MYHRAQRVPDHRNATHRWCASFPGILPLASFCCCLGRGPAGGGLVAPQWVQSGSVLGRVGWMVRPSPTEKCLLRGIGEGGGTSND